MMKRTPTLLIALCASLLAACAGSDCKKTPADADIFAPDLSNAQCSENVWTFKDGILESTKDVIIFTKGEHKNFEAEFEFKIEKGSNGGFIFYVTDTKDWTNNSLEIQICDNATSQEPKSRCGAVFGHVAPEWDSQMSYGTWHKMRVRCDGKDITTWIDGKRVSQMDMSKWTDAKRNPDGSEIPPWLSKNKKCDMQQSGKIGFQGRHGSANCKYRNLKIRKL